MNTHILAEEAVRDASYSLTRHQETTWLAQQQNGDRVFRHATAYRIEGDVDIARIVQTLDHVIKAQPELRMLYVFTEEGDLQKLPAPASVTSVDLRHAQCEADAIAMILDHQAAPWISESEPPFKVLVLLCPDNVLLAPLVHSVVAEYFAPETFLRAFADAFNGRSIDGSENGPISGAGEVATDFFASETPPIPALRKTDLEQSVSVSCFGIAGNERTQATSLAHRYGVTFSTRLSRVLTGHNTGASSVLSIVAAGFARFVCAVGGHEQVVLRLPASPFERLCDQSQVHAGRDMTATVISSRITPDEAITLVHNKLSRKTLEELPGGDTPDVTVRWISGPNAFFEAKDIRLVRLPLPTSEPRPDLELAAGLDTNGNIVLELTAGQHMNSGAGAVLLERFAAYLTDAKAEELPLLHRVTPVAAAANHDTTRHEHRPPVADQGTETSAIETAILTEFREALSAPQLSAEDDFFDFGGHSLVATRIIGRLLHNHGIEVRFNDLFSNPTAATLACHAWIVDDGKKAIGDGSVELSTASGSMFVSPLGHAQMSLWKIYSAFDYSEIFNLPFALDFLDTVDETVFEQAFFDIIERHSALRTLFVEDGNGEVRQKVVPAHEIGDYKWFWTSSDSLGVERNSEAGHRFDLASELPVRLRFLTDPCTGRQVLSFLFHHIALDEWSVNLLMDELAEAYGARASGTAPVWDDQPVPFHEFARKQAASGVNQQHLAYWTGMLRNAPKTLELFKDKAALETPSDQSAAGGWVEIKLENSVSEGLYALAKDNGASLFNVVYGAIAVSLKSIGGLSDLVIGTSASGRTDPAFFDTIGYFTTVVAHRLRFAELSTAGDLIRHVRDLINGSLPYTDIPIDLIEAELGMTPGRDHLFDVFIQIHAQNKLNGSLPGPDGSKIAFRQVDPDKHDSHLGLQFEVMEEVIDGDRSIRILMSYQTRRFTPDQVSIVRETLTAVFSQLSNSGASGKTLADLRVA
ncbi:agrobactine synthetase subunit F [Roseibium sp. RKSG952]|nr:agrobactine synthetase subunit F [Roseibium sp. RKSG952]